MKEALINLLKVKSLFSLTAIVVIIMSIFFPIPDWVQEICKIVVVFYFGTQSARLESTTSQVKTEIESSNSQVDEAPITDDFE